MLAVRVRTNGAIYHREEIKDMKRNLRSRFGFSDIYLELYEQKNLSEQPEVVRATNIPPAV